LRYRISYSNLTAQDIGQRNRFQKVQRRLFRLMHVNRLFFARHQPAAEAGRSTSDSDGGESGCRTFAVMSAPLAMAPSHRGWRKRPSVPSCRLPSGQPAQAAYSIPQSLSRTEFPGLQKHVPPERRVNPADHASGQRRGRESHDVPMPYWKGRFTRRRAKEILAYLKTICRNSPPETKRDC